MTKNQLQYWANQETERSNAAREIETARSNKEQERLKSKDQDLKVKDQELTKRGQNVSMINAGIGAAGRIVGSVIPRFGGTSIPRKLGGGAQSNVQWDSLSNAQKKQFIDKF